jgi:hypothetical protein
MLVLLAVVGFGSIGILLAVQALVPTLSDRQYVAERNLNIAAAAANLAYRRDGRFPADLDALAVAGGLSPAGAWRRDPFGTGQELDYRIISTGVRVSSCGLDGRLGTADDSQKLVSTETQLRLRQRLRLRLLRAVLLRSSYRLDGLMTAGEQLSMRTAMHDYAVAKRRWLRADATERAALMVTMASAATVVTQLTTSYGLPSLPVSLSGAGGLMSQLAMTDARAVDGSGAPLLADPVLGWVAAGADGVGGTDDDM